MHCQILLCFAFGAFICFRIFPFSNQCCHILFFDSFRLKTTATIMRILATTLNFATVLKHIVPSLVGLHFHKSTICFFANKKFATLYANTTQNFSNSCQILNIKYRSSQFDVTKISRRLHVV